MYRNSFILLSVILVIQAYPLPNYDLSGIWVKHDRAVIEKFHIKITCVANCESTQVVQKDSSTGTSLLPKYSGYYLDGTFAGHNTFNITMV